MPSCWMTTSIRKNTPRSWARRSNFAAVPASRRSTRLPLITSRQFLPLPKSFPQLKRRNSAWTRSNCSINDSAPSTHDRIVNPRIQVPRVQWKDRLLLVFQCGQRRWKKDPEKVFQGSNGQGTSSPSSSPDTVFIFYFITKALSVNTGRAFFMTPWKQTQRVQHSCFGMSTRTSSASTLVTLADHSDPRKIYGPC